MRMERALFVDVFSLLLAGSSLVPSAALQSEQTLAAVPPQPKKLDPIVAPEVWAAMCEPWDDWDKPAPPFKIASNVYYVGTCGITVLLIETKSGLVLVDTGTERSGSKVRFNIVRAGFDVKQIKLILYSHEHFDHVGGLALMQHKTGAPVLSSPEAVGVVRSGKDNPADPQAGMHKPMGPVANVVPVAPGIPVHFGGTTFVPIATPGHTPGAFSWQWEACEKDVCKTIVYADSLSPFSRDDYRFSDHPEYLAAFRAGIARVRGLKCDILLTPHPSASDMIERAATGSLEGGMTCAAYADGKTKALDERLAKEAAAQ